MDRLAIEFISVLGMPPVAFIELAAQLGVRNIGMASTPFITVPGLYPSWSLRDDRPLRKEVTAALAANGVTITVGEGFLILPGTDPATLADDLDLMAEFGAKCVNICCIESDLARCANAFGTFADMAHERGLPATAEFLPGITVANLAMAVELIKQAGRPATGIMMDSMHLFRTGSTAADLAAIDPGLIGYAQICDVPLVATNPDYGNEASFERLAPGDGELPLLDFIKALPRDVTIGLEAPMRSLAEQGVGPAERLGPALARARELLAQAG